MKKYIFTALLGLTTTLSFAQMHTMEIGIEGGPNMIKLRGNELIKKFHSPGLAYFGGVSFQYNFNNSFSLRSGLAFERKGSLIKGEEIGSDGTVTGKYTAHINLDYLTLPVLLRYTVNIGNKANLFVNAGPYIGFLLKENEDFPNGNLDNTARFKNTDFGLSTGLGVRIPVGEKYALSFEARNNLGLTNISKTWVVGNGTVKTNSLNFLVGFAYKIGKKSV